MVSKNLLRSRIAKKDLTQKELAELIGISQNSFSSKINGKKPFNTDEIDKICVVLNISDNTEKAEIFL